MPAIHVIENGPTQVRRVQVTPPEFESGDWSVTIDRAESLIGGDLYLHTNQSAPSHFGGRILSYRVHEERSPLAGRVIFRFAFTEPYRGLISRDGWGAGSEKKYVD